jgi:ADP-ribose pyrophosphatase YjhB (NUDIX family)
MTDHFPRPGALPPHDPPWLAQVREITALAQTGLAYTKDPFDAERYQQLLELTRRMLALLPPGSDTAVRDLLHIDGGYATPKVDIRVAVFDDAGRLLFVKEKSDGKWSLPGGWADINQTPAEVAVKEVLEESGLTVEVLRLAALFDRRKHAHPPMVLHVYKAFFIARILSGQARAGLETDDVAFFALDEWPTLSTARVTGEQVRLMFAFHEHPARATEFD